jgi:hypothetical protein
MQKKCYFQLFYGLRLLRRVSCRLIADAIAKEKPVLKSPVVLTIAAAFTLLSADSAWGQAATTRPWQVLSNPTASTLASSWKTPPSEYGPEPYYGLNGPITLDVVRHDLDTMKSLGFRAVTVQYGYGWDLAYLSQEYLAFFRQFVEEAKKRDMRVWIVDDAGYPSGFAGGKFTSEHPELRMQALVAASKQVISGGSVFDQDVPADTVAVTAIRNGTGEMAQVAVAGNHARWSAPSGDWTVYVVEHVFRTSPTRSDTNTKRVKDGSQSLEDYLDPAATAQYLAFTHEAYKKAVGEEFGKTILGFRGDEPDYSISGLPWTPKFFASFEAKKGYDIRLYLAAFLRGKDVPLNSKQLLARADYYDVFADLFRDGFFAPQAAWCAANGLEYQVHLNHEEQQLELAQSEGDFFRDMRFVQVPGIDSIWHQIWTDTVSDFPRLASSAAHVYGHPRAFTESFAAYRPLPDVTMARYILNEQFVRGINLVETMYYPASTGARGGPMQFMRDPDYPALMQYASRLSFLMSQGHPTAEVALLLPSESLWMGNKVTDESFVSTERLLSEHQVDFDIVDEDAIASLLESKGGAFVSKSGNRYRVVLVPNATLLPERVVNRLKRFSVSGGKVVFLGAAPALIAGKTDLQSRGTRKTDFAWATIVAGELPSVPIPPAQPPAAVPAPMIVPAGFWESLQRVLPLSALSLRSPNAGLRFTRRRVKDAAVFLLFNESTQALSGEVTLRAKGSRVETWDAESGTVTSTVARSVEGSFEFELQLPPAGSRVLVVR